MSGILIMGGGGIAEEGIIPLVGGSITERVMDISERRAVDYFINKARPEVVINCAGVSVPGRIGTEREGEFTYDEEILINLVGSFHVAEAAVAAGVQTLIFLASVAGLHGKPNHAAYSASKAGVISLVQSLAHEGHNAYAISPGRVDTSMRERDYPGEDPRTRLAPTQVGEVVRDILEGKYHPGDNVVIRKIQYDTHIVVDDGEPWKTWLRVGQPATV